MSCIQSGFGGVLIQYDGKGYETRTVEGSGPAQEVLVARALRPGLECQVRLPA